MRAALDSLPISANALWQLTGNKQQSSVWPALPAAHHSPRT